MEIYRRSGIAAGILCIVATAAGVLTLFTLGPVNAPDCLEEAAANEPKALAAALLVFIMGWAGAGIAMSMYPVLRKHDEALALGAAGFRTIEGVFFCIGASLYYWLFYRTRLVPRWLSLWGLVGLLPTVAAILLVLFCQLASTSGIRTLLNLPLALQQMVLAVWLIVRGFYPSARMPARERAA